MPEFITDEEVKQLTAKGKSTIPQEVRDKLCIYMEDLPHSAMDAVNYLFEAVDDPLERKGFMVQIQLLLSMHDVAHTHPKAFLEIMQERYPEAVENARQEWKKDHPFKPWILPDKAKKPSFLARLLKGFKN